MSTAGSVTYRGKRYTFRALAWRHGLEEHIIVGRWKRGDREERLVRPVGSETQAPRTIRGYLP